MSTIFFLLVFFNNLNLFIKLGPSQLPEKKNKLTQQEIIHSLVLT